MSMVKWEPFREITSFREAMNRLLDNNFGYLSGQSDQEQADQRWMFPVDIKDTPEAIIVQAEIPGMKKEDMNIQFRDNVLTVHGERKAEIKDEKTNHIKIERRYGAFNRSFSVDVPIDNAKITATYKDGILHITLPKKPEAQEKEIQIQITE